MSICCVRFAKKYRHSTLDERLNKHRVRAEVKGIMKAKQVFINTISFAINETFPPSFDIRLV